VRRLPLPELRVLSSRCQQIRVGPGLEDAALEGGGGAGWLAGCDAARRGGAEGASGSVLPTAPPHTLAQRPTCSSTTILSHCAAVDRRCATTTHVRPRASSNREPRTSFSAGRSEMGVSGLCLSEMQLSGGFQVGLIPPRWRPQWWRRCRWRVRGAMQVWAQYVRQVPALACAAVKR
jgi:hypothetical protein